MSRTPAIDQDVFLLLLMSLVLSLPQMLLAEQKEKEWTFLVYLSADNSLDECGFDDQEEMATIGSNEHLNIVTFFDGADSPGAINFIEKGNVRKIRDMGEPDMGDYRVLIDFVREMAKEYPARHYALVVWGHGSGWRSPGFSPITKGISPDDTSGNHITTKQLGIALSEIKKNLGKNLDVFAMDACLMQMMEVAWAIKDSCDYIVGSEEKEPPDGMEYSGMLANVGATTTPLEMAGAMLDSFNEFYRKVPGGWQLPITLSILDCSKIGRVKDGIEGLAKSALSGQAVLELVKAHASVVRFSHSANIDLYDFATILEHSTKDESMKNAARKLLAALKEAVVRRVGHGWKSDLTHGLAIYFPTSSAKLAEEYSLLAFSHDSLWDEMILEFFKKTEGNNILAAIQRGDSAPIRAFIRTADRNNAEISRFLIEQLNFEMFSRSENQLSSAQTEGWVALLKEKIGDRPAYTP